MDIVLLIVRLALALVFIASGISKLRSLEGSRTAAADLGVPSRLAPLVGTALPVVELAVAALLVVAPSGRAPAAAAALLLATFTAVLAANIARGRRPACRCFGEVHAKPISGATIVRNVVLLAGAVAVAVAGGGDDPIELLADATGAQLAVGIAIAVLGIAVALEGWAIRQLLRRHGRVLLRLDALEARPPSSSPDSPRAVAVEILPGLPVGARAPEFSLVGLHGETMTLAAFRAPGKPVLLVFSDAACGPCTALMPELARWQSEHVDRLRIVVVAAGSADTNRAKAVEHGLVDVLLQEGHGVGDDYRYEGTPGAVLVDVLGRVASPIASGAPAIRELVRRVVAGESVVRPPDAHQHHHHDHRATPANQGLAIGTVAPPLSLPTVGGGEVALSEFAGRPVVVVFWNPRCGFCQQLLPELLEWERDRPSTAPELLVVSTGDEAANAAQEFTSTVALDTAGTAMTAFRTTGTPTAVLIGSDARVASPLAVGGPAVRSLLQRNEVHA